MFALTPLQSWAFLALGMIAVIGIVWLITRAGDASTTGPTNTENTAGNAGATTGKPDLRLIESRSGTDRDPVPVPVYDWAVHGL